MYLLRCPVQGQSANICGDQVDELIWNGNESGVSVHKSLVNQVGSSQLIPESGHSCKGLSDSLIEWLNNLQQKHTQSETGRFVSWNYC